jgi:predicted secreted hydrolase
MQRRALLLACAAGAVAPAAGASVRLRPLVFPRDHGAHADTRTEWWYATGWLQPEAVPIDTPAPAFGFQVTFFRSRTGVAADHPSRFAAQQLVFAHAALTDLGTKTLHHDQRIARQGFGVAETADDDTRVSLRGWRFGRSGGAEVSRYQAALASDAGGFAFDLALDATQPVLLQGDAGFSRKGPNPEQASHYYSQPQLSVAGTLTLAGKPRRVNGRAWLDHEWSDTLLDTEAVGWDWIGINLFDGTALTAFRLRRADGTAAYAGGSVRPRGGAVRAFGPGEVRFEAQRRWSSPASRATYPVEWRVDTPAGRHTVRALLDDQELDSRASTGAIYWEGLAELLDERGQRIGLGYLEMTGYASRLRL